MSQETEKVTKEELLQGEQRIMRKETKDEIMTAGTTREAKLSETEQDQVSGGYRIICYDDPCYDNCHCCRNRACGYWKQYNS